MKRRGLGRGQRDAAFVCGQKERRPGNPSARTRATPPLLGSENALAENEPSSVPAECNSSAVDLALAECTGPQMRVWNPINR